MQDQATQPTAPAGPRYVVQPGPPTYVIVDTQAGRRVGYFPYESQSDAVRAAARLNLSHADHPTAY